MTRDELRKLYKEQILPENRLPYHFESRGDANLIVQAYNPVCGDKYTIFLKTSQKKIESAYFHGFGCAVSKASTSIMMRRIEGMELGEAMQLMEKFLSSLGGGQNCLAEDSDLQVLGELVNFDGRIDCIKLSWEAALEHFKEKV